MHQADEIKLLAGLNCDAVTVTEDAIVKEAAVVRINLSHPRAVRQLVDVPAQLSHWGRSPDVYALLLQSTASDEAAGRAAAVASDGARGQNFAETLKLMWRLECFAKPLVSLLDGAISPDHVGLTTVGTHRVAGDNFSVALPRFAPGILPVAGIAYALSRLAHSRGMEWALVGRTIDRAEAYAAGLITHCIPDRAFPDIIAALADGQPVDPVLDALHEDPEPSHNGLDAELIARTVGKDNLPAILAALSHERAAPREWVDAAAHALTAEPVFASEAVHRLIRMARGMEIRDTLVMSYRLACNMQVAVVDKKSSIDALFLKPENGDLDLPQRSEIENGRF